MAEMNPAGAKPAAEPSEAATPEDVATLYSWANLHGAKYRDFSASRAQVREATRLRAEAAAEEERRRQEEEEERRRQEEAQLAARLAAEAAEAARQAEADRLTEIARQAETERQAVLAAQEAQRQAAQQRPWQPAMPEVYQAGQGMAAASQMGGGPTAVQQMAALAMDNPSAIRYVNASQADANITAVPREVVSPGWRTVESVFPMTPAVPTAEVRAAVELQPRAMYSTSKAPVAETFAMPTPDPFLVSPWQTPEIRESRDIRENVVRPAWLAPEVEHSESAQQTTMTQNLPGAQPAVQPPKSQPQAQTQVPMYAQFQGQSTGYGMNGGSGSGPIQPQGPSAVEDTLPGSRDRLTSRWYALKGVFDPQAAPAQMQQPPARVPVLAVFSLAGGVGKTSLIASLGRALSSRGERALLVDTAAYGLLPFFFGARDQRPGMLRTFNPPGASADAPIQLVTLDPDGPPPEYANVEGSQPQAAEPQMSQGQSAGADWLVQEIERYARSTHRVLVDLPTASGATTRRILRMTPTVVVPVLPDMNSVVSVSAIESFFHHHGAGIYTGGKQIMPFYLLNQFDYSLPLHLDVREILREQIGDRLLPFALRRSPAVSEALAEGMTVIDYAPTAVVAEDFASLAGWVRSLSAPAQQTYRGIRWSER
jgi:cellulose synthase operon protein YhjQ